MRGSNWDYFVCIAMLVVFLYSFCIVGYHSVVDKNISLFSGGLQTDIVYPSSLILSPLVFCLFFFLIVFRRELEPVDRYWAKDRVRCLKHYLVWKWRHR